MSLVSTRTSRLSIMEESALAAACGVLDIYRATSEMHIVTTRICKQPNTEENPTGGAFERNYLHSCSGLNYPAAVSTTRHIV